MDCLVKYVLNGNNKEMLVEEAKITLNKNALSVEDYINLHSEIAKQRNASSIIILSFAIV